MNAELKVVRFQYTENSTISQLFLNGTLFGYVLEPKDRGLTQDMSLEDIKKIKVPEKTCIPSGSYILEWYNSPEHGEVPLYKNVKGFDMVEMHSGNFPKDTKACQLVGASYGNDVVKDSRNALKELVKKLKTFDSMSVVIMRKGV